MTDGLAGFFRSEAAQTVRDETRAQTRAEDIVRILQRRGVELSDGIRERVLACTELDQLNAWLIRAVHVTEAAELFADC